MHTSSIVNAGTIMSDLHLPEESAIASAFVANYSTVSHLTVYEGSGGGGRVIGFAPPSHSTRIALGDHISSISVVADLPDPSPAIVIVCLSTHKWSPQTGSLL